MQLELNEYLEIHKKTLQPLNIKIDVPLFEQQMEEYKYAFRRWGTRHHEYPRYGVPLVNLNGEMFNNPEPVCYPLDQWNKDLPEDEKIYDPMINVPTELLSESCFDPLELLKPYMLRSCILKWHNSGRFYPHTDTWIPSEIIRLWGTNDPKNMRLQFDCDGKRCSPPDVPSTDYTLEPSAQIEAGRLYVMDTHVIHDALALGDNVYQFFIALSVDSLPTLRKLGL